MAAIPVSLHAEVAAALAEARPVVALESSLVAQGFPWPDNMAVAEAMAAAARRAGAVPAMAAVLDGRIRLGLEPAELERLAPPGRDVLKCAARDLAFAAASGHDGATTVSATLVIAAKAGVAVFATGGIGGIHPRASPQAPLDISADLLQLSRSRLAVVCAGIKSLLDLPASFEALEALGVPVIGVGTDEFPAFHTARSGLALRYRLDDPAALAEALRRHWALVGTGALACLPPPQGGIAPALLQDWLRQANAEAHAAQVTGGAVTPFVLERLDALSGGRTRAVNAALAEANAAYAGRLAAALSYPS